MDSWCGSRDFRLNKVKEKKKTYLSDSINKKNRENSIQFLPLQLTEYNAIISYSLHSLFSNPTPITVVPNVHEIYTIKYLHIYLFSLIFMLFCN